MQVVVTSVSMCLKCKTPDDIWDCPWAISQGSLVIGGKSPDGGLLYSSSWTKQIKRLVVKATLGVLVLPTDEEIMERTDMVET